VSNQTHKIKLSEFPNGYAKAAFRIAAFAAWGDRFYGSARAGDQVLIFVSGVSEDSVLDLIAGFQPKHYVGNSFTVDQLPSGDIADGSTSYAVDGRKSGEAPGEGSGCPCYYSGGAWRCYGSDDPVSA